MKTHAVYDYLRDSGMRITDLKRKVVTLFLSGGCGLSAGEVFQRVGEGYNRSSVYRCLGSLLDAGFLRHGNGKRGVVEYRCGRRFLPDHGHFHCRICGSVIPVDSSAAAKMIAGIEERYNVSIGTVDFTLEGKCGNCV